jgi:hypothetical protein
VAAGIPAAPGWSAAQASALAGPKLIHDYDGVNIKVLEIYYTTFILTMMDLAFLGTRRRGMGAWQSPLRQ